ncbi:MAG: hypothetical protein A2Y62_21160 [Candidatus Fischerbacteria bacterium RBG_13_37_8]|uniref:MurNAc-LAA domain-containing protein n=1 Tax=Candidatus Fischerbacteria bacterium RBG_13_37_8 TaxID=1817863 RepID=A0A1F5V6E9_9BACT|nr:MAG: hypothetical protein A2Y62_21160 [Candidatus Fischerbacteria bacterium RBG_13_37_8]
MKLRHLLFIAIFCLITGIFCQGKDFTLIINNRQVILPLLEHNNESYTYAIEFAKAIGGTTKEMKDTPTLLIVLDNKNILLSPDTSYFVLDGQLVKICCNVLRKEYKWLVPLDFITKIAEFSFGTNYFWNPKDLLLIVGYNQNNMLNIGVEKNQNKTIVTFEGMLASDFRFIEQPGSLGIKFFSRLLIKPDYYNEVSDSLIKKIYYTILQNYGTYVIEFQSENIPYTIVDSDSDRRLIIEFYKEASLEQPKKPEEPPPIAQEDTKTSTKTSQTLSTIVIDPGHGGEETGAIGLKGSYEKDLTLALSRILKRLLEERLGVKVFLTREQDITLDLIDRTAIANNLKADIFISIHANASNRKIASGAETFFLSLEATDEESLLLAKQENRPGRSTVSASTSKDLNLILWDLAQTEHLQESSLLAELIQEDLNSALGIRNRGIKQAPFRVLMGADMPAVLIEIGFITNGTEEELLNDATYQRNLAIAILKSIQKFKTIREKKYGIPEN